MRDSFRNHHLILILDRFHYLFISILPLAFPFQLPFPTVPKMLHPVLLLSAYTPQAGIALSDLPFKLGPPPIIIGLVAASHILLSHGLLSG